jgi:hypothetical protein
LNQLLFSIERKTLNQFATIVLNTILFGELEFNKNRALQNCLSSNLGLIKNNNVLIGSSILNNVKDFPPFLPPINPKYKYTLVLDLDETLVFVKFLNNKEKGILHFRPYLFDFLNCLLPFYELISFTTSTKSYADSILNSIEEHKTYFSYKFYREHAIITGNNLIKDISRLGKDMSKILLIDNMSLNFQYNKENGVLIYPFYNENYFYTSLIELKKILIKIYYKNYNDIREAINDFKNEIIMNVSCNSNNYNNSINI